ncbi:MAG TPA: hypothetical protein VM695_01330 [Phycisphaerae bacterium]|nr:hypothetical protein [Phycisphaerae bacterium]
MTLLEVTLAVSLTVGLMAAAMAFYQHVVDVRESFRSQLGTVQITNARRQIMDRITDELRMAMTNPFLQMGLSGSAMDVSFVTTSLPGASVWATANFTERPVTPEADLRIVGYRLRYGENEAGEEVVFGVERTVQTLLTAEVVEEGVTVRGSLIAPEFRFIAFLYWDNEAGEWFDTWEGGDLPLAVQVILGAEPLPEDLEPADYPYPTFSRIIYVPGGVRAFGGTTVIRGLGGGGGGGGGSGGGGR